MPLTLRQKQAAFTRLAALLILHAYELGYEVTFAEAYRTPEQAALNAKKGTGIANSLHTQRLAIDLNLFKGNRFLVLSEDYRPLGEWWEAQSTPDLECCWGGRFRDGNHFSVGHGGRK